MSGVVCVVGLGFVGLTLAVALADAGFEVHGVEKRADVLDGLRLGKPHFHEPGLRDALARVMRSGHVKLYGRVPAASASTYIVTVGTPLGPDGHVRQDMIEEAMRDVAGSAMPGALVVLRSTVKIGTTRTLSRYVPDGHFAFCPERTLEGHALTELRTLPQVVGGLTAAAAERAARLFNRLTPTVIRVSSPEAAEMIKLVSNAHRDVRFAYANEIARLCDALKISAAEVIRVGNLHYPRTDLPMPGPVGGPCLTKDSHILVESFAHLAIVPTITYEARLVNECQPGQSAEFIRRVCEGVDVRRIALLGWAFKGHPATDDLRGSMALPIHRALKQRFGEVVFGAYDPLVEHALMRAEGAHVHASLAEAFDGADVVVIMNNHLAFDGMPLEQLASTMHKPGLVYDFWNLFTGRRLEMPADVRYVALGSHEVAS